jgi:aldose 1-epimerase
MTHSLTNDNLRVTVAPELGGSIATFAGKTEDGEWIDLFRPAPPGAESPLQMGMFPLVPFCNRIEGNVFACEGKRFELAPNFGEEPHACHGDGWLSMWDVTEAGDDHIHLVLDVDATSTPYRYRAEQVVRLDGNTLSVSMRVTNRADFPMPFGLGFHPYFMKLDARLQFYAESCWLEGPGYLPSERITVPPELDHAEFRGLPDCWRNMCYGGWDGKACISYADHELEISCPDCAYTMIFLPPDEDAFCFEPMSHCVGAFSARVEEVEGPGLKVLAAGESMQIELAFRYKRTCKRSETPRRCDDNRACLMDGE